MIDVPAALAAIHAAPGEHVVYTKEAAALLLREVAQGQRARRQLASADTSSSTGSPS